MSNFHIDVHALSVTLLTTGEVSQENYYNCYLRRGIVRASSQIAAFLYSICLYSLFCIIRIWEIKEKKQLLFHSIHDSQSKRGKATGMKTTHQITQGLIFPVAFFSILKHRELNSRSEKKIYRIFVIKIFCRLNCMLH